MNSFLGAPAGNVVNYRCVLEFNDGKHLTKMDDSGIKKTGSVFIADDKINMFFLLEGVKHAQDFFDVGYGSADKERLRKDISDNFDIGKADEKKTSNGVEKFSIFMDLGITQKKRIRTEWQKDTPDSIPRIITAHRE